MTYRIRDKSNGYAYVPGPGVGGPEGSADDIFIESGDWDLESGFGKGKDAGSCALTRAFRTAEGPSGEVDWGGSLALVVDTLTVQPSICSLSGSSLITVPFSFRNIFCTDVLIPVVKDWSESMRTSETALSTIGYLHELSRDFTRTTSL